MWSNEWIIFIDLGQDTELRLEDVPVCQIITNYWEQNNIMLKITEKGITANNLGYVKQLQDYIFLQGDSIWKVVRNCLF